MVYNSSSSLVKCFLHDDNGFPTRALFQNPHPLGFFSLKWGAHDSRYARLVCELCQRLSSPGSGADKGDRVLAQLSSGSESQRWGHLSYSVLPLLLQMFPPGAEAIISGRGARRTGY